MSENGGERSDDQRTNGASYAVGYCRPPLHTRFKPGQSGNPSGRVKGSKNLRTLFHQILNEQIPLQDGAQTKKVTKAEALMRRLVIGALKGDSRSVMTWLRSAGQTGEFESDIGNQPLSIQWLPTGEASPQPPLPANRRGNSE